MILVYEMRRRSGETVATAVKAICDRHRYARQALGWVVASERRVEGVSSCDDCDDARSPTVLDRIIATGDAVAADAEPEPVKVLPGQRRLF